MNRACLLALLIPLTFTARPSCAQTQSRRASGSAAASPAGDAHEKNVQAYIDLLRSDVRQQKSEIMGAVMLLSAEDAKKFWPIYAEYDAELKKLNDQRIENIKEYTRLYTELTDAKADELIVRSLTYQKERAELLAKTYERVKQELGAITAARFTQIEHQLLLIIDLQIASALPIVGQGS
jgi:hypothetical protein